MTSSTTTSPPPVAVSTGPLTFVVAGDASVVETHGRWGRVGRPQLTSVLEFVHPDAHDVVVHALRWAGEHGMVDRSIVVDVRTPSGWSPAALAIDAEPGGDHLRCSFSPLAADPIATVATAIAEDRRLDVMVERALGCFATTSPDIWVSVHHGMVAGSTARRRRVAHAIGHDGFASAVVAAAGADHPLPWDQPVVDEPVGVAPDALGDGLVMAARRTGVTSATLVPIPSAVGDDAAAVMLWVDHVDRLADPAQSSAVERLVQALTLAFGHEALRETLRHVATHDELTGLWNLPAMRAQLTEAAPAGRAVAVLDIEDFTGVNARYGHVVGDQVLVELARRLREVVRPGDFVARPSGDTFVVVCAGIVSDEEAEKLAERLMSVTYQPLHLAGDPVTVRASMGLVHSTASAPGPRLLEAAHRLLDHTSSAAPGTWNSAAL